jgi:hypothetical protein
MRNVAGIDNDVIHGPPTAEKARLGVADDGRTRRYNCAAIRFKKERLLRPI